MGLRNLPLRAIYDSGRAEYNIEQDFYVPVLCAAKEYNRLAGYFSSNLLLSAARGIAGLIKNNGKMRIIASPQMSQKDIDLLTDSTICNDETLAEYLIPSLSIESLTSRIQKDHLSALAWMLRNGVLEIKIAVPRNSQGIFHQKMGIVIDNAGDMISFSGSINETYAAWNSNIEQFKVFTSWDSQLSVMCQDDHSIFSAYWNNEVPNVIVRSLPDAVFEQVLSYEDHDVSIEEILQRINHSEPTIQIEEPWKKGLRNYQIEAIDAWFNHGCRGVIEMATGTGKTRTAIAAVRRLEQQEGDQLTVITAPTNEIARHWAEDIGGPTMVPVFQFSDWRKKVEDVAYRRQLGDSGHLVMIVVQDTAAMPSAEGKHVFSDYISKLVPHFSRTVIVGDECHGLGSPGYRSGLLECYDYRLGLSATPERWFDDLGTATLYDYFGGKVFSFDLNAALSWRDPKTQQPALCPYKYFPILVELNDDERERYDELSAKIARTIGSDEPDVVQARERLSNLRAKILKKAAGKIEKLRELLSQVPRDTRHCLVYCDESDQLDQVAQVFFEDHRVCSRFTGGETSGERDRLLESFNKGAIGYLLSMQCLDEGVDIPSARMGIILASTTNPRQFIQRRGRLLRPSLNKEYAIIYDFVITRNRGGTLADDDILVKEYKRVREFADSSMNPKHTVSVLGEEPQSLGDEK